MKRAGRLFVAVMTWGTLAAGCNKDVTITTDKPEPASQFYRQTNLIADQEGAGDNVDPNLVNPWGVAFGPETFFWVANNGTSTSTLYDGDGMVQSDSLGGPVTIPGAEDDGPIGYEDTPVGESEGGPTGVVYNGGVSFVVSDGTIAAPARFIFATMAGTLVGWSPDIDPRAAQLVVDKSNEHAVYTGLAISRDAMVTRLYVANLGTSKVDMFDENFDPVSMRTNDFVDPDLPEGYAPFNVQEIEGLIYVAYAKRSADEPEEEPGPGNGYVSAFDTDGEFVARVASGGSLDAPWGLVRAPKEFGRFGGALLVGNFGDGRITAFDWDTYEELGQLEKGDGKPIVIEGLWALVFGNGSVAGEADELYFTAGPDDETHGLFGEIAPF